jgi:hypothetical protein
LCPWHIFKIWAKDVMKKQSRPHATCRFASQSLSPNFCDHILQRIWETWWQSSSDLLSNQINLRKLLFSCMFSRKTRKCEMENGIQSVRLILHPFIFSTAMSIPSCDLACPDVTRHDWIHVTLKLWHDSDFWKLEVRFHLAIRRLGFAPFPSQQDLRGRFHFRSSGEFPFGTFWSVKSIFWSQLMLGLLLIRFLAIQQCVLPETVKHTKRGMHHNHWDPWCQHRRRNMPWDSPISFDGSCELYHYFEYRWLFLTNATNMWGLYRNHIKRKENSNDRVAAVINLDCFESKQRCIPSDGQKRGSKEDRPYDLMLHLKRNLKQNRDRSIPWEMDRLSGSQTIWPESWREAKPKASTILGIHTARLIGLFDVRVVRSVKSYQVRACQVTRSYWHRALR